MFAGAVVATRFFIANIAVVAWLAIAHGQHFIYGQHLTFAVILTRAWIAAVGWFFGIQKISIRGNRTNVKCEKQSYFHFSNRPFVRIRILYFSSLLLQHLIFISCVLSRFEFLLMNCCCCSVPFQIF
jgi:hypothetical protein